jgi:acyl-CoA synthetase (AMP-forming)/AMP-acid ligase II
MLMRENFDPAFTLECLTQDRIDVLNGVPAMLARLVDHPDFARADLTRLRYVSWGAGPINARVLDALMHAAPKALFSQQYGMTESNGPIVFTPPTRDREILLGTTGRPDPRLSLRIADADDRPLLQAQDGEVQVRHPHPFAGYLDNPEATAASFTADGWLRTGDLARIRDDGYLVFCGRSKEMFKSGGFNVYPREIELALEDLPQVRAAAVIGIDDETWGQVGHAFVELATPADPAELLVALRGRLANYKVPKALSVLEVIPRIGVSKIDRIALARRLTQG